MTTEGKENPKSECPSSPDEMAAIMEKCGCGPMMAKMMAACMDAGRTGEGATEAGTKEES